MTPLNNKWVIWFHGNNKDWTINGYRKLYEIKTIEDFWEIYIRLNNFIILKGQFFLMKNDILPIWENKENIDGGCWSYKINKNESFISWLYLSMFLSGEILTPIKKSSEVFDFIARIISIRNFDLLLILPPH